MPQLNNPTRKEPGNRAGALGLLVALAGGWALIPEVPSVSPEWGPRVGSLFLALGVGLAALGLVSEWRGPKRWSALVPGIFLLDFCLGLAGLAAWRTGLAYRVDHPAAVAGAQLWTPRSQTARGAVLLTAADREDTRLLHRLAAALAREGVGAMLLTEGSTPQATDLEAVRVALPGVPVGVLAFGAAGEDPACLNGLPADFLALISVSISDAPALGPEGPRLLGVYGFNDTVVHPHENGQKLAGIFAASGRPQQVVRLFIGSDHQLRRSGGGGLLPAPFAASFVQRLATWMEGGDF